MKKLQCNFTTTEQSKWLLELGIPEWTSDCCFSKSKDGEYICEGVKHIIPDDFCVQSVPFPAYPCWLVGRLIEIMKICAKPKEQAIMAEEMLYCKDLVELLVYMIEANKQVIDFSKLEE